MLQAAALATQAAFSNPALQPILMGSTAPWLNPIYQGMGLVNPATANSAATAAALAANAQLQVPQAPPPNPMLDPSGLSAGPYGAQLQQGPQGLVNGAAALSLLQQQQAQVALQHQQQDPSGGWALDPATAAASNLQLFYQNAAAAGQPDWARAAAAAAAAADPRYAGGLDLCALGRCAAAVSRVTWSDRDVAWRFVWEAASAGCPALPLRKPYLVLCPARALSTLHQARCVCFAQRDAGASLVGLTHKRSGAQVRCVARVCRQPHPAPMQPRGTHNRENPCATAVPNRALCCPRRMCTCWQRVCALFAGACMG